MEKEKRLSIRDIAEELNTSITTVSFVINGRDKEKRISDHLVDRIKKHIEMVGYIPSNAAKTLRTGKSYTLGLIVEDISDPFFASIAQHIEDQAYENGYKVVYCSTYNNADKTLDILNMFHSRSVDGYIVVPPPGIESKLEFLMNSGKPVILLDRKLPLLQTDSVLINNYQSAFNAAVHLIEKGYKNIGFVTFFNDQVQMVERVAGYTDALTGHTMQPIVKKLPYNRTADALIPEITEFITSTPGLDAIIFGTNRDAIQGLKAIRNLGLSIPGDIAVITFDDSDVFQMYTPAITSIAQPVKDIATHVITTLLSRLNGAGSKNTFQSTILETNLIVRAST
ncbi:LacI family transcriptional regulator [archaeon]|nr:MAG: LacI family transcriptional regulator [archaeon]